MESNNKDQSLWKIAFAELFPNWDNRDMVTSKEQAEIAAYIKGHKAASTPSPPSERVEDAEAILKKSFDKHIGHLATFAEAKGTNGYDCILEAMEEYRQSQPVQAGQWVSEKPEFTEECILLTHTVFRNAHEYQAWQIVKIEAEDGWYWGLCNMEGEEWGALEDLKADHYKIVSDFIV